MSNLPIKVCDDHSFDIWIRDGKQTITSYQKDPQKPIEQLKDLKEICGMFNRFLNENLKRVENNPLFQQVCSSSFTYQPFSKKKIDFQSINREIDNGVNLYISVKRVSDINEIISKAVNLCNERKICSPQNVKVENPKALSKVLKEIAEEGNLSHAKIHLVLARFLNYIGARQLEKQTIVDRECAVKNFAIALSLLDENQKEALFTRVFLHYNRAMAFLESPDHTPHDAVKDLTEAVRILNKTPSKFAKVYLSYGLLRAHKQAGKSEIPEALLQESKTVLANARNLKDFDFMKEEMSKYL